MRCFTGCVFLWMLVIAASIAPTQAQNYVAFSLGTARTADSTLRIIVPSAGIDLTYRGVHWHTEANQFTYYYGLRFGGYFRRYPHWGLEFNYTHNKAIIHTNERADVSGLWHGLPISGNERIRDRVQQIRFANGENIFALNLLYRTLGHPTPSFPHGRFQAYVGIGPAFFALVRSVAVDGVRSPPQMQFSSLGWETLFGVRYGLSRKFYLFAEAKYTRGDAKVDTVNGGRVEAPLRTWHTALGLMFEL